MRTLLNRLIFTLLVTSMSGGAYALAGGEASSVHSITPLQRQEIRFQRVSSEKWTDREVRMTIRAAVRRWPVPGGLDQAFDVARCESGFEAKDSSPGSGHEGVYQQATAYWAGRQNAYDSQRWHLAENVNNGRSNVIVSVRMAHGRGWGDWAGCA